MRGIAIIVGTVAVLAACATVRAGPIHAFTDLDQFLAAAGDVHEIDFETLPDGTPSYVRAEITPEFNYSAQGAEFFAHVPPLRMVGNEETGFLLCACPEDEEGPGNWITAELVTPARAVGILFPGGTTLTIIDADGNAELGTWTWGGTDAFLLGVTSDAAIGSVIVGERGGLLMRDTELLSSFLFTPVPEGGTLLLLATVGAGLKML